jgi:hypothetical protein
MHWLKNDQIEAGFSHENGIRLSVLRRTSGENLLREASDPCHGLKTWVMAPSDLPATRDMLSERPAAIETESSVELRLRTTEPNEWGLVLEWVARMIAGQPGLEIVHRIHNQGPEHRHIGIWSIAAFPADSVFRVPFARSPHVPCDFPNTIAVFPWANIGDNRISSTREFLQLEVREGKEADLVKIGLVQPQGCILVRRGRTVLKFTAPYSAGAEYPEGGSNVTLYTSPADEPPTLGEAEHMGPLEVLMPGDSIELPVRIQVASP